MYQNLKCTHFWLKFMWDFLSCTLHFTWASTQLLLVAIASPFPMLLIMCQHINLFSSPFWSYLLIPYTTLLNDIHCIVLLLAILLKSLQSKFVTVPVKASINNVLKCNYKTCFTSEARAHGICARVSVIVLTVIRCNYDLMPTMS